MSITLFKSRGPGGGAEEEEGGRGHQMPQLINPSCATHVSLSDLAQSCFDHELTYGVQNHPFLYNN